MTPSSTRGLQRLAGPLILLAVALAAVGLALPNGAAQGQEGEGNLELRKVGGESGVSYTFELDGPDTTDEITVQSGATVDTTLDAGTYVISEERADDAPVDFLGWAQVADSEDACPASPQTTTESLALVIPDEQETIICAYNGQADEDDDGTLTIRALDAPATQSFMYEVTEGEEMDVVDSLVVVGGSENSVDLEPGDYTVSELEVEDYVLTGWALADSEGECPDEAESTEGLADITVEANEELILCAYHSDSAGEGTLTIQALGAPASQSFLVEVTEGEEMDVVDSIEVAGGDEESITLAAGEYTLSELEVQDYVLTGWALADSEGDCPAGPDSEEGLFDITIEAGEETIVCTYHSDGVSGTLTVVKVGAPASASFNIEVTEGEDMTPVDNVIVAGGEEESITIEAGEYTLSELESQDYVLQGWALASSAGVCPAAPTTTDGLFDVEVTVDEETIVCVFNQGDQPSDNQYTYTLHFRWTLVAWLGEDGISVEDAVTGEGDNASGDDVSDDVLSIWYWVPEDQSWLAYFTGDTTGASDLETLQRFSAYWVAIDDDNDPVSWTIVSTVDGDDDPAGHASLEAAMEAYVEGRGEEYSGDCADADIEDDIGTWCSDVNSSSANSAEVAFGPVFSEFLVVVTFERQDDNTWVAVDEEPVEPPDA